MIFVDSKKKSEATLLKKYPNAKLLDVTSKAEKDWVKLSPFYPHGDIPVPFSEGITAKTVEGIWQGLKVFQNAGIDKNSFENATMKNIKRTVQKYGTPLGHQKGVFSTELLGYIDARIQIYLPSYLWVLENKLANIISFLRTKKTEVDIVLLDYDVNCDIYDTKKPLSHAFLIKSYLENKYPSAENNFCQNAEIDSPKNELF